MFSGSPMGCFFMFSAVPAYYCRPQTFRSFIAMFEIILKMSVFLLTFDKTAVIM